LFPYYINIEIPQYETSTTLKDLISSANASSELLNILANIFSTASRSPVLKAFKNSQNTSLSVVNTLSNSVEEIEQIKDSTNTAIDAIDLLSELISSPELFSENTNYFVGQQTLERQLVTYQLGELSTLSKNEKHISLLNEFSNYLNSTSVFNLEGDDSSEVLQNIFKFSSTSRYSETIAYKIEKSDARGHIISNFWVYADNSIDVINLVDSQIKLSTQYIYAVYEYKMVHGFNYTYSDDRITKIISSETDSDGEETGIYVLEFESSGTTIEQLFETEEDNAFLAANPFATNAQIQVDTSSGDSKYLFDFNVTFSPSLKIIEIPLFAKSLIVKDHPGTSIDIVPYQVLDNSQKIGFHLIKEAYAKRKIPTTLSPAAGLVASQYGMANDLIPSDYITANARTRLSKVDVYRINTRPNSYADFRGNLLKSISMIDDDGFEKSRVICENTVRTNQKYYYIFQFFTQGGMPGTLSEIYEVELVDDGGYKYAIFETIHESDLDLTTFNRTSIEFKKIFQILPNSKHIRLITDDADFGENSYTQLENVNIGDPELEDPIWGKTFKIRLTSKKTGKKIDLNITYNLESG